MRLAFTLTILVDGVHYKAGDQVEESEISPGTLESLKRLGQVVEVPATPSAGDKKSK